MSLSNDLVSQFVKMTSGDSKKKNDSSSSYGTTVEYNGEMYVKLDGSDLLTPVDTTTELRDNDRVLVNISGHHALVSGNMTNPAVCKATAGELHSEIVQTAESIRLEVKNTKEGLESQIEQTAESIRLEVKNTKEGLESQIEQTAESITTRITNVESDLNSKITQTASDLTIMFNNGYEQGITTINKDGIKVQHSGYGGYTHMSASGFYLNNGSSDVLKCTSSGLVYTGTITASSIQSTDKTFAIDKNGNIAGATITTSKGGNFSIDEYGNMVASGLAIEDSISTKTIICDEIMNKAYPKTLTGTVNLYINPSGGNDDNECINGAVFTNLQAAINKIPKFLNGKTVNIYLQGDCIENINLLYYCSGRIFIYLQGHSIYGSVHIYHTNTAVYIYGGSSTSDATYGTLHASTGLNVAGRSCTVSINQCKNVTLYYINLYSPDYQADGLTGYSQGLGCQGGGYVYCSNIKIVNCDIGFRANSGCQLHMNTSSGIAQTYGFQASTGAKISFADNAQAGGTSAATYSVSGGQIWRNSCTFESGSTSTGGSAPTATTTKTVTYTASSAQALQYYGTSSAFWRTDCKPKVGDWGYGAHTGWWFFGDDFGNMASKNVTKIEITFYREKAGYYAATTHYFYAHGYESQPGTVTPSYNTSRISTASVAVETSSTMTITDSTIINRIKTAKGICSIPPGQSGTYYSVMGAGMKVKFTYTE